MDVALADYKRAIELEPDFALAYSNRGAVRVPKGDLDGALADHNRSIELDPKNTPAYHNRGLAKYHKGDSEGALADYNRAIELDPKSGVPYSSRGCLRYNAHAFSDALVDFRKRLNSDSGDLASVHHWVWLVRARLGERDAATKELRDYLDQRKTGKPDDWLAQMSRFLAGQLTEADFLKAADSADKRKDTEQHCGAWFYAGTVRLIAGDKAAAKDYFEKCLATGAKTLAEYLSAEAELKFLRVAK